MSFCNICTHAITSCLRLVLNGARLIAVHKARYYKRSDGLALGPGPFVTALEYAAGREATVVGKPEPAFFYSVLRDAGHEAGETVMIGDVSVCIACLLQHLCTCTCLPAWLKFSQCVSVLKPSHS